VKYNIIRSIKKDNLSYLITRTDIFGLEQALDVEIYISKLCFEVEKMLEVAFPRASCVGFYRYNKQEAGRGYSSSRPVEEVDVPSCFFEDHSLG